MTKYWRIWVELKQMLHDLAAWLFVYWCDFHYNRAMHDKTYDGIEDDTDRIKLGWHVHGVWMTRAKYGDTIYYTYFGIEVTQWLIGTGLVCGPTIDYHIAFAS